MHKVKSGDVSPPNVGSTYTVVLREDDAIVTVLTAPDETRALEIVEQWKQGTYKLLSEG